MSTIVNIGTAKHDTATMATSEETCAKNIFSMNGSESSTVYMSLDKRFITRPIGILSK